MDWLHKLAPGCECVCVHVCIPVSQPRFPRIHCDLDEDKALTEKNIKLSQAKQTRDNDWSKSLVSQMAPHYGLISRINITALQKAGLWCQTRDIKAKSGNWRCHCVLKRLSFARHAHCSAYRCSFAVERERPFARNPNWFVIGRDLKSNLFDHVTCYITSLEDHCLLLFSIIERCVLFHSKEMLQCRPLTKKKKVSLYLDPFQQSGLWKSWSWAQAEPHISVHYSDTSEMYL